MVEKRHLTQWLDVYHLFTSRTPYRVCPGGYRGRGGYR